MKIIGIDSSGLASSVAVLEDDKMVAEYTLNHKKTHSTTLMPMLAEILKMAEIDIKSVDAIGIASGPGSFTGLRIGSATAKGLAYSIGKPIISVPTTEALAFNIFGFTGIISPIMDARRNQVYNGLYTYEKGEFKVLVRERALGVEELIEELNTSYPEKEILFLGDGVEVYKDIIDEKLTPLHYYAPAQNSKQRAGSVAVLSEMYYNKGEVESAFIHAPVYLRLSQAERERKEKENGQ